MLATPSKSIRAVVLFAYVATTASTFNVTQAHGVEGAFGLRFDAPIPTEQLGATTDASLLNSLFSNQPQMQKLQTLGKWHALTPMTLPLRLKEKTRHLLVQVTEAGHPAWIAASFRSQDGAECSEDLQWLRDVLRKKYGQLDLTIRPPTALSPLQEGFAEHLSFEFNEVMVSAGCTSTASQSSRLQIEYWHRQSKPGLELAQELEDAKKQALTEQRAEAATVLGKLRGRAVASTVASGTRYKIEQVFGLPLERAVKTPGNFVVDEFVDYPLQGVSPPYRGKVARVQLGPTGHLIRFELKLADANADEFHRLQGALKQQFAAPTKATSKHVIFTVGADYLVLRRRAEQLEFTLISGAGEKGLKSRQLAAQEKQWQAENAGI